ncbi:hypothetical protein KIPB_011064 [Kipferlia bialata]|uniref:Uncharacterized protein n=1 Tax=Kipferlia bialata TaxID=797122 RepID=A0A9K3D509_9EUKA|nr:hypothetical protein KIPB_011064 [Kipferlia bialata]|eukprot:g11064.t1
MWGSLCAVFHISHMASGSRRRGDGPVVLDDSDSETENDLLSEEAKTLSRMAQWRLCWRIGFPTWTHRNTLLVYAIILVCICQAMVTMVYTSVSSWVVCAMTNTCTNPGDFGYHNAISLSLPLSLPLSLSLSPSTPLFQVTFF